MKLHTSTLVMLMLGSVCSGAAGGAASTYYFSRVVVSDGQEIPTGAQLQISGPDGGLAIFHTDAADGEAFMLQGGPLYEGAAIQKSMSVSTIPVHRDPLNGWWVTRYNTGYMQDGTYRDDIALQICGGQGIAIKAPNPKGLNCPGRGRTVVYGDVEIRGRLVVHGQTLAGDDDAYQQQPPEASGLSLTATACATPKPGADWTCYNGGWLPPGMIGGR
jgi:hypothetical protein